MPDNPALQRFIQGIPLFELVQPHQLMDILRLLRPVTFWPGQVLFREGEPGQAMWVLGTGMEVAISTTPAGGGRPVVAAYAKAGETIGE
ncbi:MAG TPA: cyclic nucleotide-binding domain-containing protein, partial [Myxococcales bacterium]|nr:cyclic nucleotide-binding domain-containing protein [Myxococcales bacterium]